MSDYVRLSGQVAEFKNNKEPDEQSPKKLKRDDGKTESEKTKSVNETGERSCSIESQQDIGEVQSVAMGCVNSKRSETQNCNSTECFQNPKDERNEGENNADRSGSKKKNKKSPKSKDAKTSETTHKLSATQNEKEQIQEMDMSNNECMASCHQKKTKKEENPPGRTKLDKEEFGKAGSSTAISDSHSHTTTSSGTQSSQVCMPEGEIPSNRNEHLSQHSDSIPYAAQGSFSVPHPVYSYLPDPRAVPDNQPLPSPGVSSHYTPRNEPHTSDEYCLRSGYVPSMSEATFSGYFPGTSSSIGAESLLAAPIACLACANPVGCIEPGVRYGPLEGDLPATQFLPAGCDSFSGSAMLAGSALPSDEYVLCASGCILVPGIHVHHEATSHEVPTGYDIENTQEFQSHAEISQHGDLAEQEIHSRDGTTPEQEASTQSPSVSNEHDSSVPRAHENIPRGRCDTCMAIHSNCGPVEYEEESEEEEPADDPPSSSAARCEPINVTRKSPQNETKAQNAFRRTLDPSSVDGLISETLFRDGKLNIPYEHNRSLHRPRTTDEGKDAEHESATSESDDEAPKRETSQVLGQRSSLPNEAVASTSTKPCTITRPGQVCTPPPCPATPAVGESIDVIKTEKPSSSRAIGSVYNRSQQIPLYYQLHVNEPLTPGIRASAVPMYEPPGSGRKLEPLARIHGDKFPIGPVFSIPNPSGSIQLASGPHDLVLIPAGEIFAQSSTFTQAHTDRDRDNFDEITMQLNMSEEREFLDLVKRFETARTPDAPQGLKDGVLLYLADSNGLDRKRSVLRTCAGVSFTVDPYEEGNEHTAIVESLLEAGARVNVANNRGETPLHRVAKEGPLTSARVLIDAGAVVNERDKKGRTPLYIAVTAGRLPLVEELIQSGADVCSAAKDSSTPLHVAAHSGYAEMVRLLLIHGADRNAKDMHGLTPPQVSNSTKVDMIFHRRPEDIVNAITIEEIRAYRARLYASNN